MSALPIYLYGATHAKERQAHCFDVLKSAIQEGRFPSILDSDTRLEFTPEIFTDHIFFRCHGDYTELSFLPLTIQLGGKTQITVLGEGVEGGIVVRR